MSSTYVVVFDETADPGSIEWDGRSPIALPPGARLVVEAEWSGERAKDPDPEPTPDDRLATLEAKMSAIAAAPDFARAKVGITDVTDVTAVKDSAAVDAARIATR